MKPEKAYRHDIGAWELVQDGYSLGYIKRFSYVMPTKGSRAEYTVWKASTDGVTWHDKYFSNRAAAREYLETQ